MGLGEGEGGHSSFEYSIPSALPVLTSISILSTTPPFGYGGNHVRLACVDELLLMSKGAKRQREKDKERRV